MGRKDIITDHLDSSQNGASGSASRTPVREPKGGKACPREETYSWALTRVARVGR